MVSPFLEAQIVIYSRLITTEILDNKGVASFSDTRIS